MQCTFLFIGDSLWQSLCNFVFSLVDASHSIFSVKGGWGYVHGFLVKEHRNTEVRRAIFKVGETNLG